MFPCPNCGGPCHILCVLECINFFEIICFSCGRYHINIDDFEDWLEVYYADSFLGCSILSVWRC